MRKLINLIICLFISVNIYSVELSAWSRDKQDENIYNNPFTYTTVKVMDQVSETEAMFNRFVFDGKPTAIHESLKKDIMIQGNKKLYYDYNKKFLYIADFEYNCFILVVIDDFKNLKDSYDSIRILFEQIKNGRNFWTIGE